MMSVVLFDTVNDNSLSMTFDKSWHPMNDQTMQSLTRSKKPAPRAGTTAALFRGRFEGAMVATTQKRQWQPASVFDKMTDRRGRPWPKKMSTTFDSDKGDDVMRYMSNANLNEHVIDMTTNTYKTSDSSWWNSQCDGARSLTFSSQVDPTAVRTTGI